MNLSKIPTQGMKLLPGTLETAGSSAYYDGYPWTSAFGYAAAVVGSSDCVTVWYASMRFLSGWIGAADTDRKVKVPRWMRDMIQMGTELP
jgi:hypothetical protein